MNAAPLGERRRGGGRGRKKLPEIFSTVVEAKKVRVTINPFSCYFQEGERQGSTHLLSLFGTEPLSKIPSSLCCPLLVLVQRVVANKLPKAALDSHTDRQRKHCLKNKYWCEYLCIFFSGYDFALHRQHHCCRWFCKRSGRAPSKLRYFSRFSVKLHRLYRDAVHLSRSSRIHLHSFDSN